MIIDVPEPPKNFTITSCESDDHSIELNWIASVDTSFSEEVEDYVLEQSLNGGKFQLVRKCISNYHPCSDVIFRMLFIWSCVTSHNKRTTHVQVG